MNEIFLLKKDKDFVLNKIEEIFRKYQTINATNDVQRRTIMRQCCHDIDCMLDECFEPSLLGVAKCKQKTNKCYCVDNPMLVEILGEKTCGILNFFVFLLCKKIIIW